MHFCGGGIHFDSGVEVHLLAFFILSTRGALSPAAASFTS